ncbi:ATP-dependent RecD-like DNA helicase (plasmid) [Aneurinibacillus sp. Ricciae_BoGa-3]|uniref:SF1B family DNA helicase RecD2 n=1 Tax=Aneurinibacillus sp. Ricciae_BoGa-3 TaxID=3022697 RepID=UPI002341A7EF|nr:ATP-dependent RecD-like DNA helicase [Aneurinibacillus sp. Ricciae_BoGa-3]WCK57731.1 ATP-dependent RecD-like DNA helicase [Aneurinibacillus sp. Ricciae_BoGa-3]
MIPKEGMDIPVKFEVVKIRKRFDTNGYTIFEAKFTDYPSTFLPTSEIVLAGNFPSIFEEDEFEGVGSWKNHNIYGYGFNLEWAKRLVPQTEKGIQEFLKRCVKGIGNKTAEKIVQHFGLQTISQIEADWKNLLKVPGMGEKRAKKIHEKMASHKKYEDVAMYVLSNGGGYKTALRIYEALGDSAIIRIKENPYSLCSIPKISFPQADKFAKNERIPFHHIERVKQGILYFLENDLKSKGNLYVTKRNLSQEINSFLLHVGAFKDETNHEFISYGKVNEALDMLIEEEKVVIEEDEEGVECIYTKSYHVIENQIVKHLKKLVEESKTPIATTQQIEEFITEYETTHKFPLAEKQKEAVFMALQNGMSILTGGPGTGKTQTINTIIQCIRTIKPTATIHLCAPTGKASKRMTELTGMEAMTIHRTIGLNGFQKENKTTLVQGDFVIIDESSMIDAFVFYKLLEAIDEDVRILFVGDYEQLPSVGAGLILRDLINSKKIPTTVLTEIFRQARESQIVMNSHKIIKGIKTTDKDGLTFDTNKNDFYFIQTQNKLDVQSRIIEMVDRFVQVQGYKLRDIQVLSPMRKGDLGVWRLNRLMQQKFNPPSATKKEWKVNELNFFREGDKVIQTVNNYDLEVFNGEVGYIHSISRNKEGDTIVEVEFDDKTVAYDELSIEEVELAFVITIHKSQGSEFPVVIMPIHSSQEGMLNKNLIYTAWTRAKETVVSIGSKDALDKAIDKTDNTIRFSKIKEKIAKQILPIAS